MSQQPAVLDAYGFRSIVDLIYNLTPYEGLLHFRGVCRALKQITDSRLLSHIIVDTGNRPPPSSPVRNGEGEGRVVTADGERIPIMFGKTLSAMIDVFATEPQRGVLDLVGMSQPLASLLTLGFDTVRMDESAVWALGHMRSMTKFHSCLVGTRRLVVFETREEFEFGPISRPRLIPPYNVKKYVVNVHTDRAVEHFTTELRSPPPHILLQHFVIIFDPKFVPSKAPRSDDNDPYSGFLFPLLSDNIKLWTAGSKHQLTMVNFPQLKSINPSSFSPHWASAFRPHETFQEFQKCFKLHLITASFWEMFSEKDEFSSASWIESRVSDTRFLTLNEYAAELSTHDFEMETDRSTFKSWIETRQEEFPGDTDLEDLDTDTEDAMSTPGSRQLRRLPAVILSPSFGYLSSSDSNTSLNSLF